MKDKIKTLQEICTELHDEHGLTDEVLSLQVTINKLRHKHNVSDKSNRLHETYVQQVMTLKVDERKAYLQVRLRNLKRRYARVKEHADQVEDAIELKCEIDSIERELNK